MVNLAIIGGGPAGTAAAIAARRHGLSVAIWERDRFPRDKVCGEFISAESLSLLGAEIPRALARATVISMAEFTPRGGRAYSVALSSPACGLSRWAMDEALWRAAAASGAQAFEATAVRSVRRLNGATPSSGWEIESEGGEKRWARALLVACGRWWSLGGFPSPARSERAAAGRWMGAKAHFEGVAHRDAVEMYFFPGGYCGLAPVEGSLYNACCLIDSVLVREWGAGTADFARWINTLARHPALEGRLRGATQVSETVATAPVRVARRHGDHEGALLAGDAAGFLDPFTGDGISQALHAGRLAAECVATASSGEMTDMTDMTDRGSSAAEHMASSYRRGLTQAVWRSYAVAGLVRALVCAPAAVQSAVATAVPWLGPRLLAATRWQETNKRQERI